MARQERSRQPKSKFKGKAGLVCGRCYKKTTEYAVVFIGGRPVVRCVPYCPTTER